MKQSVMPHIPAESDDNNIPTIIVITKINSLLDNTLHRQWTAEILDHLLVSTLWGSEQIAIVINTEYNCLTSLLHTLFFS